MIDTARELENLVLALPGVVAVYAAEPAVTRSAKELLGGPSSRVAVTGGAGSNAPERIVASVGVSATAQAPVTAAGVAAAIRAVLPAGAETEIVVRISSVRD